MFLVRVSFAFRPVDREAALAFIRREVTAAQDFGLVARLLVPLTRGHGGASMHVEVEMQSLDQLETFANAGLVLGMKRKTGCAHSAKSSRPRQRRRS